MTHRLNSRQSSGEEFILADSMNDQECIAAILAGNRDEYRHIVSRYKDNVFRMLMRQTGNRQVAEELTQQTFIRAYRGLASFRGNSSLLTWIIRIALNCSHSYFNSSQFKRSQRAEPFDAGIHSASSESPQEYLERKERLKRFRVCLAGLKASQREILTLCALEEHSYEHVASLVEIPVGTVRSRLNTARLKLKECMQRALLN